MVRRIQSWKVMLVNKSFGIPKSQTREPTTDQKVRGANPCGCTRIQLTNWMSHYLSNRGDYGNNFYRHRGSYWRINRNCV